MGAKLVIRAGTLALAALAWTAATLVPVPGRAVPPPDWPQWRVVEGHGAQGAGGLELLWKVPLGSGYSSVAVAGETLVTLFAAGPVDVVAAFHADTGAEIWRQPLDPAFQGMGGADPGPLSSPVIAGDLVYALGPRGRLVALGLADGSVRWSVRLTDSHDAVPPGFGFIATPLIEGRMLIVPAGGPDGRAVLGLDRFTGVTLWSHSNDGIQQQSPAVLELAGRRQVVLVTQERILGLDPANGGLIWSLAHGRTRIAAKAHAVGLDSGRFLVDYWMEAVIYAIGPAGDTFAVHEETVTRDLRQSFAPPAVHRGHLYGFSGAFLTCLDAATGQRRWRSRPPGGRTVTPAGDRLLIPTADGAVVLAVAHPDGYRELHRVEDIFRRGSITKPSVRQGRVYVRDLESLAALALTAGGPEHQPHADLQGQPPPGPFADFLAEVRAAGDPAARVRAFLESRTRWPLVEAGAVHFLWHGDAVDVALNGDMVDDGEDDGLFRVPGTRLWHRTYVPPPDTSWRYRFQVDFERWETDARNPETSPYEWDDSLFSHVTLAGHPGLDHLQESGPPPRLARIELASTLLDNRRSVAVWLPPGHESAPAESPLVVVADGEEWLEKGRLGTTLENLAARFLRPPVVALVGRPAAGSWWAELGGERQDAYVEMVETELLPRLQTDYGVNVSREDRVILGAGWGASAAVAVAAGEGAAFGRLAVMSMHLDRRMETVLARLAVPGRINSITAWVDWGIHDARDVRRGTGREVDSLHLQEQLRAGGHRVLGGPAPGGEGWGGWRGRSARVLLGLLGGAGAT